MLGQASNFASWEGGSIVSARRCCTFYTPPSLATGTSCTRKRIKPPGPTARRLNEQKTISKLVNDWWRKRDRNSGTRLLNYTSCYDLAGCALTCANESPMMKWAIPFSFTGSRRGRCTRRSSVRPPKWFLIQSPGKNKISGKLYRFQPRRECRDFVRVAPLIFASTPPFHFCA